MASNGLLISPTRCRRYKHPIIHLWFVLLVYLSAHSEGSFAQYVALVIGNDQYETAPLRNPANDARTISSIFLEMGYDHVDLLENADSSALSSALDRFSDKAASADVAVIYYAGHGVQIDGKNYAIPLGVQLTHPRDVRKLTSQQELVQEVARARQFGLVILDACRDNPFASRVATVQNRSTASRGLARESDSAVNTVVAYATASDDIASDGVGANSPYAVALIENIGNPKLDIFQLFGKVRDKVIGETNGAQQPYLYGSLGGERYYLHPGGFDRISEFDSWQSAIGIDTVIAYENFLRSFPRGNYTDNARKKLQELYDLQLRPISIDDLRLVSSKFDRLRNQFMVSDWSNILADENISTNARKKLASIQSNDSSLNFSIKNLRAREKNQTIYADIVVRDISAGIEFESVPLSASRNRDGVWSSVSW